MEKGKHSTERVKERKVKEKKKTKKRWKRVLLIFIILILIIVGVIAGFVKNKLNKINYVDISLEDIEINDGIAESLNGYRNIALLGVDTRDVTTNDGSRSDAIIIVSVNKETKDVKLISVYRDTYLYLGEEYGLDKVTHAHAYDGPALTISTLNQNLDLNISEFVTVNFEVVAEIIDMMGGIEIDIQDYELTQMNKYIEDTSKNTGISSSKLTHSGKQTLDGVQAVTYSRIRKTAGGDYKRTERMRTVLTETFNKAKQMSISDINKIADKVLPQIQTNISQSEIVSLISQIMSYNVQDSIGWPYDTKGITLDRWYGVPVTLESNVKQLHEEVFGQSDYEPTQTVKDISNKIINKTGYTQEEQ